jgi:hypothetical protein
VTNEIGECCPSMAARFFFRAIGNPRQGSPA